MDVIDVAWVKYREYSGCKIPGKIPVPKPVGGTHMDRAFYLTALIEAPFYGAVQSYDGAAMSGGPLHNIAVQPRTLYQGSMFSLLRAIEVSVPQCAALLRLWEAYREQAWAVTKAGMLNDKAGLPVKGQLIRNTFTPVEGVVPRFGPEWHRAARWAIMHHDVFSAPETFEAQKSFSIDWLLKSQRDVENVFYKGRDPRTLTDLPPEEDLAMCVYHCYSVNAPAPAKDELIKSLQAAKRGAPFAATLISSLSKNTFGNWEVRYVRTRNAAINSGLWSANLFNGKSAIFPARSGGT